MHKHIYKRCSIFFCLARDKGSILQMHSCLYLFFCISKLLLCLTTLELLALLVRRKSFNYQCTERRLLLLWDSPSSHRGRVQTFYCLPVAAASPQTRAYQTLPWPSPTRTVLNSSNLYIFSLLFSLSTVCLRSVALLHST